MDIAPELIEEIQNEINKLSNESRIIKTLYYKVAEHKATYTEAQRFAKELGNITAKVFKNKISSAVLPDGRMYYNIAERLFNSTFLKNYGIIAEICTQVQNDLNKSIGTGLKAKVPELNQDRVDGLIDKVSDAELYDDAAWVLDDPVINLHQSIVDDFVETNAEFHSSIGLKPVIQRTIVGNCCDWCKSLAGSYIYPDVPREVFQRHERCRCEVTYAGDKLRGYTSKSGKTNTFRK